MESLRIGSPPDPYFIEGLKQVFPDATPVPLESPREFFVPTGEPLDVMVDSAEAGSAWCLVYPEYSVVVPEGRPVRVPLAYPIARGNASLLAYVDTWIDLGRKDGTLARVFDYWILGQGATRREPRWSVIRNVLDGVDVDLFIVIVQES